MKNSPAGDERLTAGRWLASARRRLASHSGQEDREPGLETQLLLAHVLNVPRSWIMAHPEAVLGRDQQAALSEMLQRLQNGAPLPYLLGHWEFFGLDFEVSPAVLIPRPETELLVERALAWLHENPGCRQAVDAGAGSGCIAVSLAKRVADVQVLAADRSRAALEVARRNAARHGVQDRLRFLQADLLTAVSGPFHLVCANLPYIPQAALTELPVARFEPRLALDGGTDGLKWIRRLLADARRWLAPGGKLLLEMQLDQGEEVSRTAQNCLPGSAIAILPDLAGLPRLVEITSQTDPETD